MLWQEFASTLQAGDTLTDGDRQTFTTYILNSDSSTYRLHPTDVRKLQYSSSGGSITYAHSAQTWDSTDRVPLTDEVWFDGDDANRAITRRAYDMSTGNVLQRWKPVQNVGTDGVSGNSTTYTYDIRGLFIATEVNEVGHQFQYTYEPGTGTKLSTIGPNVAACAMSMPPTCGTGTVPSEQHSIRVDGVGRMIERYETFSDDGSAYTLYKIETNTYTDPDVDPAGGALTGADTSVMHQRALDVSSGTVSYAGDKSEMDGHGRPIKKTVYVYGTAPTDQITTFAYRNDGTHLPTLRCRIHPKNDAAEHGRGVRLRLR